jgi:hypothetical protein
MAAGDLVISWDGKEYRVPENQMFQLIDAIERHITLPELLNMMGTGKVNFGALAVPLHSMLTFAGVRNVPSLLEMRRMLVAEGMANIQAQAKGDKESKIGTAMAAVASMTQILMDGAPEMEADEGKKNKPHSPKAAIKSRSVNGASRRVTSGA